MLILQKDAGVLRTGGRGCQLRRPTVSCKLPLALLRQRRLLERPRSRATRNADAKSEATLPVGWPKPKTPVVSAPPAPVLAPMLERPALPLGELCGAMSRVPLTVW